MSELTEQTGEQRNEGDTDEGNAAASHELLHTLGLSAGVIIAVTFKQIDYTPNAETSTESDNESLKNADCRVKKFHIVSSLKMKLGLDAIVPTLCDLWFIQLFSPVGRLAEKTGEQRHEGNTDEGNAATSHELLHTLGLSAGVIVAVAFEQVDYTPNAETGTKSDNEGLENTDSRVEKFHRLNVAERQECKCTDHRFAVQHSFQKF